MSQRPLQRQRVSKHRSAHEFRKRTQRTLAANLSGAPMRGGIRL